MIIISRTPYRISFFGGGTDYPTWYKENGGDVVSTSIDKYCYITCRYLPPFFEHKYRIVYSTIENTSEIEEIHHPTVRETLKYLHIEDGLEIHHDGDLPARTGIGSSSSFTVGLLNALYALKGKVTTKMQLAQEAIYIEQTCINECVGSQDQVLASFGGLNHVHFSPDNTIEVKPLPLSTQRIEDFQNHLMLFFTGFTRTASHIAKEQVHETPNRKHELTEMQSMTKEAIHILTDSHDILDLGRLLHEYWQIKRSLTCKISSPYIDYVYSTAQSAGAVGGKVIGAGGGGFMLFMVAPENQERVKENLNGLLYVPFNFENYGSQIIFQQPDTQHGNHHEEIVIKKATRRKEEVIYK